MSVRTRAAGALVALVSAAAVSVAVAPAAHAAALNVTYDASGSTLVKKPNSTVALGPSALAAAINPDGTFTASLPLPPSTASFKALGLLPTTATVSFISAGPVTGQILNGGSQITSTAVYTIKLSNVKVAGLPAFVGSKCQTKAPVSIPASGPFSVTGGGTLTGTYTIGNFANCGLTTGLINLLIPGGGNTVSFVLSNGRLG